MSCEWALPEDWSKSCQNLGQKTGSDKKTHESYMKDSEL